MTATHLTDNYARARNAWTAFWREPDQTGCALGAPELLAAQRRHWMAFARSLPNGARVLDLGCGAGEVARAILAARADVHVSGVDFARIPLVIHQQIELLSSTRMESLLFANASFAGVVSQFGFEYSDREASAKEATRVLAPEGRLCFLVHHADSAIVATNRLRSNAFESLLDPSVRAAFCSGDAAALNAQTTSLSKAHRGDALVVDLTHALRSRLSRPARERIAIWAAIEEALAPERCILQAMLTCSVAPGEISDWLEPLRQACELNAPAVLHDPNGVPLAWKIEGIRRK